MKVPRKPNSFHRLRKGPVRVIVETQLSEDVGDYVGDFVADDSQYEPSEFDADSDELDFEMSEIISPSKSTFILTSQINEKLT